ncbi:hypothetical protein B7P43_G01012 [Cryptotermes secundus]|uniref:Uncharacterized protein n=1 Tax=Cryptotermes secundus TaxID=105785 RepID=A0A2J7PGD9_9NEOP|nr:hypothetical protein B7P43_G01012 [Cryptotermes secundus]
MQHKIFCIREFSKSESATVVQRAFNIQPPTRKNIYLWNKQFDETGSLCKGKSPGRSHVSEENVERIRVSFERSPMKSTRSASRELETIANNCLACIEAQDGAPPHWHLNVRRFLNESLPQRWIGRMGNEDLALQFWPPRSPDLTPCDFFLWGFVKDAVYVPPLPTNLNDLRNRITAAVNSAMQDICHQVWMNSATV